MAVEAADNGKAVFIEKPMALTHADAKAIVEAEKRNGVVIFVGYMRRYAAAYERMKEEIASIKNIRYATVRDIIGLVRSSRAPSKPWLTLSSRAELVLRWAERNLPRSVHRLSSRSERRSASARQGYGRSRSLARTSCQP